MDELAMLGSRPSSRGLGGLVLLLVGACAEPLPKAVPTPAPALVVSVAPVADAGAPPPPPSRKAGPALFVGKHQTWVVLASGRVATWGKEGDRRGEVPAARPVLVAKSKDIVGLRDGSDGRGHRYEDDPCEMRSADECTAPSPTTPHPALAGARLFAADEPSQCGLLADGTLRCVGPVAEELESYEIGALPARPRDFGKFPDLLEISVGEGHACAVRKGGEVICWGHVGHGFLGDGRTFVQERAKVIGVDDAVRVSLFADGGCAIRKNGNVACWGSNARGGLGVGVSTLRGRAVAADLPGVTSAVKFVADGRCVIRSDAKLQCWGVVGTNDPAVDARPDPAPYLVPVDAAVDADVVYGKGLCVVRKGGAVDCFGKKKSALSRSSGAIAIASDNGSLDTYTCVLLVGGRIRCWVAESAEAHTRAVPKDAVEVDVLAVERYVHPHDAVAVVRATSGVLAAAIGAGAPLEGPLPKPTPRGLVTSGSLEVSRTDCARMAHGTGGYVYVAKDGTVSGADGNPVADLDDAIDVADNDHATCVVRRGGTVECWGEELGASLGRGRAAYVDVPVKVPLPEPALL